jgi:hypothetical protein
MLSSMLDLCTLILVFVMIYFVRNLILRLSIFSITTAATSPTSSSHCSSAHGDSTGGAPAPRRQPAALLGRQVQEDLQPALAPQDR